MTHLKTTKICEHPKCNVIIASSNKYLTLLSLGVLFSIFPWKSKNPQTRTVHHIIISVEREAPSVDNLLVLWTQWEDKCATLQIIETTCVSQQCSLLLPKHLHFKVKMLLFAVNPAHHWEIYGCCILHFCEPKADKLKLHFHANVTFFLNKNQQNKHFASFRWIFEMWFCSLWQTCVINPCKRALFSFTVWLSFSTWWMHSRSCND